MNAASFLEDPVAYDARVRAKDVGLREMRAARPREPYGFLEPIDYIIVKSKFQNAASNIELDEIDKVTELANVFANPAKEIIDGQQLVIKVANMRQVYETLWKQLDEMFQTSANPFQSAVDSICRKGRVPEADMKAHQSLIGTLYKLENVADLIDAAGECDREANLREIINSRVPHISNDFWKASARQKMRDGTPYGFQNLIDEVKHWVSWNTSKDPMRESRRPTQVAATVANPATFRKQHVISPEQSQPRDICNICEGRHHSHVCNILEAIPGAEDRVRKLAEKRLCFHCFGKSHSAKLCKEKPTCAICNKTHATLLHDRQFSQRNNGNDGSSFEVPTPAATAAAAASKSVAPGTSSTSSTGAPASAEQDIQNA